MRPTRLRPVLGVYLALLLGYGVMVAANDGWNEQIVEARLDVARPADVITPAASAGWAILIVATVVALPDRVPGHAPAASGLRDAPHDPRDR